MKALNFIKEILKQIDYWLKPKCDKCGKPGKDYWIEEHGEDGYWVCMNCFKSILWK